MSGDKEGAYVGAVEEVETKSSVIDSNGAPSKTSSCSSGDSPVLQSQKTEPAVDVPAIVKDPKSPTSPKVGQKELLPPVPDASVQADEIEAKAMEPKEVAAEQPSAQTAPSKLSAVAAARAAMLAGGSKDGGSRPAPKSGVPVTDVRKRALASHQMMQAWGKKKRGPRAENQFLKVERSEAEAYALDISMRLYMELIRGLDGNGDVARCCISAEETRKLRRMVMDTLAGNLDSLMKEFCIEVPDPDQSKKAEEDKLKSQAGTAAADLEKEEERERDWETKKVAGQLKELASSVDDDSQPFGEADASSSSSRSKPQETTGEIKDAGAKEKDSRLSGEEEKAASEEPEAGEKEPSSAQEKQPSEKESPESTKDEGKTSDDDSEDSGASDKKKRKSRKKKSKKPKKKDEDLDDRRKPSRAASHDVSVEDLTKDDVAEDGGSEVSRESKSESSKRNKRKKGKAKYDDDDPPLRAGATDSKARKKKRSRRLSTSAIAAVFVSNSSNSGDEKGRASRREKKEKKEKLEKRDEIQGEPDASSSLSPSESSDLKKKHRFPGAGPLGRLLKKTNSRLDNSSALDETKELKKGRGRDRKKSGKKDEEGSESDSGKKGSFQRPMLTKDGSSSGSRGRNRQRSAAGRPMLTRGGTGAKMAGPSVATITLKRNMVDVEKLNALLEEAIKSTFGAPSRIAGDYCPHDEGELDYYFLSLQGPRAANEDEYCVVEHVNEYFDLPEGSPNYSFFGVYDGHSGKFGSIYTRSQLIYQIFHHPDFHTDPDKAFNDAFLLTDKLINDIEERENFDCGTTAISCCIRDHKELLISNVGDCEGFTCRAGEPVRMAIAHRPSDEAEKARIKALGGAVVWFGTWRVNGMLAVSRSLGDQSVKNLVIAQPDTSRLEVTPEDEFLVCASDGIWDVLDFPGAIEIVYKTLQEGKGRRACCKEICEEALRRGTKDNVTVVVIFFRKEVAGMPFEEQVKG